MAGAYCNYCQHRCFVYREVKDATGKVTWWGHMATCTRGAEHDRQSLGVTFREAYNPYEHHKPDDQPSDYDLTCR